MLAVFLSINKQYRLVNIGQKRCKGMRELEERGKRQALLFLSATVFSFHGFSIAVQPYWPFMIHQFCVSSSC